MTAKELFLAVGEVPEGQIAEAGTVEKRRPVWRRYAAAAACLAVMLAAAVPQLRQGLEDRFQLGTVQTDQGGDLDGTEYSVDGETVSPTKTYSVGAEIGQLAGPGDGEAQGYASSCMAWLSPEEIMAMDTEIFRGTVRELQYYAVDLGGLSYYTRAVIQVTETLRGEMSPGDVCTMLFYGAKGYMFTSVDGPLTRLEEGSDAVFMPGRTGPDTGWRDGERYFCYGDLAELYLSEGERFVFLDTGEGLAFSRSTYAALAEAEDLDEVVMYLRDMLDQGEE